MRLPRLPRSFPFRTTAPDTNGGKDGEGGDGGRRGRGGFVILIVLVVLAILSAAVVSQLAITGNNTVIGVRSADDAKARALAEGCLTMLQVYADTQLCDPGTPPCTAPIGKDFDLVLNPDDSAAINGDEFYPLPSAGEQVVSLPKGIVGACPGASCDYLQRHRWLLIPQNAGGEAGACLVRFDDNSDETLPLSQIPAGVADDAGEGLLAASTTEVTHKDRDRAIFLTSIGVFPFLSGTPAADVYARAHARVTLRRLYNAGAAAVASTPAIFAGGDVSGIKGTVCGGGIVSGGFAIKGFVAACGCGQFTAPSSPPVPSQCTVAQCPPPATCTAPSGATAPINVPNLQTALANEKPAGVWGAGFTVFANESFGPAPVPPAAAPANNLGALDLSGGTTASCKLHYASNGDVYVWDRLDTSSPITGDNCSSYSLDPVRRPCTWAGATAVGATITTCTAGVQTSCWKLVHRGAAPTTWRPNNTVNIPNVAVAGLRWGAPTGATYLCGAPLGDPLTPTACNGCDGTTNDAGTFSGTSWTFAALNDTELPVPAYMAIENSTAAGQTTLSNLGEAAARPLHATVISLGPIDTNGTSGLCGVGCACPPGQTVASALCVLPGMAAFASPPNSCYALRSAGRCGTSLAASNHTFTGAVRCGLINDDKDGVCYLGPVAAMGTSPATNCAAAAAPCGPAVMCWKKNVHVVGDIYASGAVQTLANAVLTGTIAVADPDNGANLTAGGGALTGDFCPEGGSEQINGSIIAAGNVFFKGGGPSPMIVTGSGPAGPAITALRQVMETAW